MMLHKDWILVAVAVFDLFTTDDVLCTQISLWVASVEEYSSQWDDRDYSADRVIGMPDVYPSYGDLKGAWAQDTLTENEFIQVRFDSELYIEKVNIYETFNCGGVWKIEILTILGWTTVWEIPPSQVQKITASRIFSPDINFIRNPSNMLKLTVNCAFSNSWVEIDAIQIVGRDNIEVSTQDTASTITTTKSTRTQPATSTSIVLTTQETSTAYKKSTIIAATDYTTELTSDLIKSSTAELTTTSTARDNKCCCTHKTNITEESLSVRLEEIRRALFVPRNLTGRYNRSKHSAGDDRPSSIALGTSAGIVTMVLLASLIIACDISYIYRRKHSFRDL